MRDFRSYVRTNFNIAGRRINIFLRRRQILRADVTDIRQAFGSGRILHFPRFRRERADGQALQVVLHHQIGHVIDAGRRCNVNVDGIVISLIRFRRSIVQCFYFDRRCIRVSERAPHGQISARARISAADTRFLNGFDSEVLHLHSYRTMPQDGSR